MNERLFLLVMLPQMLFNPPPPPAVRLKKKTNNNHSSLSIELAIVVEVKIPHHIHDIQSVITRITFRCNADCFVKPFSCNVSTPSQCDNHDFISIKLMVMRSSLA